MLFSDIFEALEQMLETNCTKRSLKPPAAHVISPDLHKAHNTKDRHKGVTWYMTVVVRNVGLNAFLILSR